MNVAVARLALTPVKGTRLLSVHEVELGPNGARGDRRFFLIDGRGRMLNGKQLGELSTVVADYDEAQNVLALSLPDGRKIVNRVQLDGPATARFYSRTVRAQTVIGPWSTAISELVGQRLELVYAEGSVDRGRGGGVSLISQASLARLAQEAGRSQVDARRFRMLIEIDGVEAHAEDAWVGKTVRIGNTSVRLRGHVGRCLITSRHPETGEIDLPTLDLLGNYRHDHNTTEPLPFGVYGQVVEPGVVTVGDPVVIAE